MPIITSELVANATPTLVANGAIISNAAGPAANVTRVTLGGLGLPTTVGSVTPAESVQVSLYVGANGLSNDALVFTQTAPVINGAWAVDILSSVRTVASNLQVIALMTDPTFAISAPATNAAVNIANTGCKLSVYFAAVNGGSNGSVTVETGVVANVS